MIIPILWCNFCFMLCFLILTLVCHEEEWHKLYKFCKYTLYIWVIIITINLMLLPWGIK
jgi:hypothetical protein